MGACNGCVQSWAHRRGRLPPGEGILIRVDPSTGRAIPCTKGRLPVFRATSTALLLWLVTCALVPPSMEGRTFGRVYFDKGRALAEEGAWARAIPYLRMALDLGETAQRQRLLAECHERIGSLEAALFHYRRAYLIQPDGDVGRAILKIKRKLEPAEMFQRGEGPPPGMAVEEEEGPAFVAKRAEDWLRHPDPAVRSRTARAFGRLKTPSALPELYPLLKDKEALVRSSAAEAIGAYADMASSPLLVEALEEEQSTTVQLSLLAAMESMPGTRANREALARLVARRPVSVVFDRAREVEAVLRMRSVP